FELGLSEFSQHEQISLLAYSPLAAGTLTGKYLDGQRPANSRLTLFDRVVRYSRPQAEESIKQYIALAEQTGITPAQLALAFVNSRPFIG
ncbi:aldo/keto reductase, partial [Escherichia coli]|uniref:aldo/keto reductase n=1 Tax=Escherichia coli TaxID=562 RepID=UPI0019677262